jgi:pyruvate/2-oxoglutarate dehydrogenase complex dihydrolipoamide acyltransferase (E2) component
LIEESNVDPSVIVGSGAGGRITRTDVLAVNSIGRRNTST